MAYRVSLSDNLERDLHKLYKKDRALYDRIEKRVDQLKENPHISKPLGNVLKYSWRVHVGHFVLMYTIDENNKVVEFYKIEHHDKAYESK
jgi:mRNA-degrading endonuclease RelE of RelBE toxin-antitoxin system